MNRKSYLKKIALSVCMASMLCLYLLEGRAEPDSAPAAKQTTLAAAPADSAGKRAQIVELSSSPAAHEKSGGQPEFAQSAPAETGALGQPEPGASGFNLATKEKSLYVDLAREIEISERERGRIESLKDKSYQANVMATELKSRLDELNKLKEQLNAVVPAVGSDIQKGEKANEKLQLLVTLYESLSPDQAAGLMKRLPVTVSLTMFQMMNPKKSSKILAAMEPKMAAELSQRLIRSSKTETKGGI